MDGDKQSFIVVTGAGGFIGRAVTNLLDRSGRHAVLVDQDFPAEYSTQARKIACDISDAQAVEKVFAEQPISGVIHLAAILPTAAQKEPCRTTEVNVRGSLNLLEAAREFHVKRFVFGSSLSIYGTCVPDHIVSEVDPAAPEDLYGAAKLYVEQLGRTYAIDYGIEFASLRIGRVVGPGARSRTSAWRSEMFEFLREAGPTKICLPYVGSERILLVHVADVAEMLVNLVETPRLAHTIYNAPCESMLVSDLKRELESLNPNISVVLGDAYAVGNPRQLNSTRFQREFGFVTTPIVEQLRRAANH